MTKFGTNASGAIWWPNLEVVTNASSNTTAVRHYGTTALGTVHGKLGPKRFFMANSAPENFSLGKLGPGKFVSGKLGPANLPAIILYSTMAL